MQATLAGTAMATSRLSPLDLSAEVALVVTTFAAVQCFARLFVDGDWFAPVVTAVLVAHVLAAVVRHTSRGVAVPVLASVGGALGFVGWSLYPETTVLGLPGPSTLDVLLQDLSEALSAFGRVAIPAPTRPGFVAACVLAAWIVAWFADTAAFRLRAPLEAVVPAVAILVFTAMLGSPDHRISRTVALVAALLMFLLLHRIVGQLRGVSWMGRDVKGGVGRLVGVGAVIALSVTAAGAVLGPELPGADSPPALDWRGDPGRGTRMTVSPLVDIRDRLVEQSDRVAFTVQADEPAYWRLTSLEQFDGRAWKSDRTYAEADDEFEGLVDPPFTRPVEQTFHIKALDTLWAPAAYQATSVESATDLLWDDLSGALIVDTDVTDSNSIRYDVVSQVPHITRRTAKTATGEIPDEIAKTYLDLPPDFKRFKKHMQEATSGADTPYEKALAMQSWFRTFTYDVDGVSEGHDDSAVATFLKRRKGYCEQFAGTFAAFARLASIPARVAVGFTPGDPVKGRTDLYEVKGKHAHAWPEVYLAGLGWVAFEPTPDRGMPGAEDYTGIQPQQERTDPESAPVTAPTSTSTTAPTSTSTTAPAGGPSSTSLAPLPDELDTAGGPGTGERSAQRSWLRAPVTALAVLFAVALLYVALVRSAVRLHRTRRRARAGTPSSRIGLAWQESAEAMAMLGPRPQPAETYTEFASRAAQRAGRAAPALVELAGVATMAAWSANGTGQEEVDQANRLTATIRSQVHERLNRRSRLRAELHPSLLVGHTPERFAGRPVRAALVERLRSN